jgi:hypothetical protein
VQVHTELEARAAALKEKVANATAAILQQVTAFLSVLTFFWCLVDCDPIQQ